MYTVFLQLFSSEKTLLQLMDFTCYLPKVLLYALFVKLSAFQIKNTIDLHLTCFEKKNGLNYGKWVSKL